MHDFAYFPVCQISRNLNTTTSIVEMVKTVGTEYENFAVRNRFFSKKRKKISQNFNVLRRQAAVTLQ